MLLSVGGGVGGRGWVHHCGSLAGSAASCPFSPPARPPAHPPVPPAACSNITIPATFVTKSTGEALKALLKGGQAVYVSMDWTDILPKKQQVGGTKEMKEEGKRGAAAAAG